MIAAGRMVREKLYEFVNKMAVRVASVNFWMEIPDFYKIAL